MSSALLLVSATELPRQIPHQSLLLIRASRKSWLMGQVFYLFAIVFVTIVFMTSCMLVFSFGKIVWQTGWSDTMRLSSGLFVESNAAVSDYIRSHYLPCQAFLVALLPPALFWVTLLLIILLCGIWRRSEVGVLIDAFIILSSIILSMDMWPSISLPMSYTTLRSIHPEYYGMQKYWHVILVFIILDLSMIIFMVMSVKKMDFAFENENKE